MNQPKTDIVLFCGAAQNINIIRKKGLELGLLPLGLDEMHKLREFASATALPATPMTLLKQMLDDLAPRIMKTSFFDRPPIRGGRYKVDCPYGAVGRIVYEEAKAFQDPMYNNRLILAATAVNKWCEENKVRPRALCNGLKNTGVLISTTEMLTIGKGTTCRTKPQRCWIFDLEKIKGDENGSPTTD